MKKIVIIPLIIIALLVGGGVGWALRGTRAGSPSATTASSGTASQSGGAAIAACTADSLTAKINPSSGGAATGNRYYDLVVTNSRSAGCMLNGYPGVSLLSSTGATVGSPANKDTSSQAAQFTLGGGQSATATLKLAESDNYPAGTCTEGAATVKVYPPNATGYLSVPSDMITTWCPGFTTTAFSLD